MTCLWTVTSLDPYLHLLLTVLAKHMPISFVSIYINDFELLTWLPKGHMDSGYLADVSNRLLLEPNRTLQIPQHLRTLSSPSWTEITCLVKGVSVLVQIEPMCLALLLHNCGIVLPTYSLRCPHCMAYTTPVVWQLVNCLTAYSRMSTGLTKLLILGILLQKIHLPHGYNSTVGESNHVLMILFEKCLCSSRSLRLFFPAVSNTRTFFWQLLVVLDPYIEVSSVFFEFFPPPHSFHHRFLYILHFLSVTISSL